MILKEGFIHSPHAFARRKRLRAVNETEALLVRLDAALTSGHQVRDAVLARS